jgi:tetratricopeptide (TPR) repeat protein
MKTPRLSRPVLVVSAAFVCAAAVLMGHLGSSRSASSDLAGIFARGNALYEGGDYEGAIDQYTALVGKGVADPVLYYNLGNAYYKVRDLGHAVLYYERARRLAPRDGDVRENLALVRAQLRDKQFVRDENRLVAAIGWLHNNLSAGEMTIAASIFYAVLCFLAIVFVLRETAWVSSAYRWFSYVSLGRLAGLSKTQDILAALAIAGILFVSTGISAYQKTENERSKTQAVVLGEEVSVLSGPTDDATLQFKIHQGTIVRIRDHRGGWMRIALPGGLSGWVSTSSMERV